MTGHPELPSSEATLQLLPDVPERLPSLTPRINSDIWAGEGVRGVLSMISAKSLGV